MSPVGTLDTSVCCNLDCVLLITGRKAGLILRFFTPQVNPWTDVCGKSAENCMKVDKQM